MRFCSVCGKKITHRNNKKYCSTKCVEKANINTKFIKRCPLCLCEFKTYKKNPQKYCSILCSRKAQANRQSGSGSHFWKGGSVKGSIKIRTHPLYKNWRTRVFSRDDYTCQSCFKTSKELKRGKLCAHHIKPFANFKRASLKTSNGITLCWQCHRDLHKAGVNKNIESCESRLRDKCSAFFKKEPGVKMYKIIGNKNQESGIPDFLGVCCGQALGIELKIPPNFASPIQKYQIKRIQDAGGKAYVCRSLNDVKRVIYSIKESDTND